MNEVSTAINKSDVHVRRWCTMFRFYWPQAVIWKYYFILFYLLYFDQHITFDIWFVDSNIGIDTSFHISGCQIAETRMCVPWVNVVSGQISVFLKTRIVSWLLYLISIGLSVLYLYVELSKLLDWAVLWTLPYVRCFDFPVIRSSGRRCAIPIRGLTGVQPCIASS